MQRARLLRIAGKNLRMSERWGRKPKKTFVRHRAAAKTDGVFDGRKSSLFLRAAWQERVAQAAAAAVAATAVCMGIRLRISKVAAAANGWCFGEMRTLPHPVKLPSLPLAAASPSELSPCDAWWHWAWEIARHYWRLRKFARIAHMSVCSPPPTPVAAPSPIATPSLATAALERHKLCYLLRVAPAARI